MGIRLTLVKYKLIFHAYSLILGLTYHRLYSPLDSWTAHCIILGTYITCHRILTSKNLKGNKVSMVMADIWLCGISFMWISK